MGARRPADLISSSGARPSSSNSSSKSAPAAVASDGAKRRGSRRETAAPAVRTDPNTFFLFLFCLSPARPTTARVPRTHRRHRPTPPPGALVICIACIYVSAAYNVIGRAVVRNVGVSSTPCLSFYFLPTIISVRGGRQGGREKGCVKHLLVSRENIGTHSDY